MENDNDGQDADFGDFQAEEGELTPTENSWTWDADDERMPTDVVDTRAAHADSPGAERMGSLQLDERETR